MAIAIGLMSGTSLDGIDAALVNITGSGTNTKVELIAFHTKKFTKEMKSEIKACLSLAHSNVLKICSLNFKLGKLFSIAVKEVCEIAKVDLSKIDFIASHGQTMWHQPNFFENYIPSTLQIGEPAVIAYEINTTVVSNFRVMDMAAGGEGAPLVPFSEYILYATNFGRILQNIGGIGNLTVLPANCTIDDVFAFDTGPGNMIVDEVCQRLFNVDYDSDGRIAGKGNINQNLLDELMKSEFIYQKPPKSTGRELYGAEFVDKLIKKYNNVNSFDFVTTVTKFTAKTIAYHYKKYVFPNYNIREVILAGGGSYNSTLVNMIKDELINDNVKVLIQEDLGLSSDGKEAIAFAVLGNETLNNNPSNAIKATGAKEYVILGNITPKPIIHKAR